MKFLVIWSVKGDEEKDAKCPWDTEAEMAQHIRVLLETGRTNVRVKELK